MNTFVHEPLPPDMIEADRDPLLPPPSFAGGLGAVAPTLLIPLAARAHGDAMFPRVALLDTHAARMLARPGADVAPFLADRATVYGVLARTGIFRRRADDFFQRHPRAIGVSLGAGLGHYFQWLDRGTNTWIDADLPEVHALREGLLPRADGRRLEVAFDLTEPGWWRRLGPPTGRHEPPVLLLCEGVPAPHRRLRIDARYPVMEGYGLPYAALGPAFQYLFGVPLYAIAELGVDA